MKYRVLCHYSMPGKPTNVRTYSTETLAAAQDAMAKASKQQGAYRVELLVTLVTWTKLDGTRE